MVRGRIISSFKFIQKLWNLNLKILNEIKKNHKNDNDLEITKFTNIFIRNVTNNLNNFSYNKIIANLHEMYSFLSNQIQKNYKKNTLIENYQKILIIIQPIIPHFSNECLENLNSKTEMIWPNYDESLLYEKEINIVVQFNGKKRGLLNTLKDLSEEDIIKLIMEDNKLNKYLLEKDIKRKIYIKDKLINIIL